MFACALVGSTDLSMAVGVEWKGVGIVWRVGMVCIWLTHFGSSGSIECESNDVRRGPMLASGSGGGERYSRFANYYFKKE